MSALGQTAPAHVLLRSPLNRDRRVFILDANRRRGDRHPSVGRLLVHLATTSLAFLVLISLVWIVSWTFHSLHAVYPFSDEVFWLLEKLEMFLVYVDVSTSGVLLIIGIWRYVVAIIRGDS